METREPLARQRDGVDEMTKEQHDVIDAAMAILDHDARDETRSIQDRAESENTLRDMVKWLEAFV
jgi:hypothetical protein